MSFTTSVVPTRLENHILVTAHHAREKYFPERKQDVLEWELVLGVYRFLNDSKPLPSPELRSLLTDSRTVELPEFARHFNLDRDQHVARENAFTGNNKFSPERFAAMVTLIASRRIWVSKAKLEIILYYSDMVNYVLYSSSISGSKYVRNRFRPEMADFDKRIDELVSNGTISIDHYKTRDENIVAGDPNKIGELSMLEIVTIHWVMNHLGQLPEREVVKYAEAEHAHRFTRVDGFIAYEYGRLLKKLPEALN